MQSIIFYGAGQNAREKIEYWLSLGLNPVCFADADINKQHTYFNKWEILSLLEAISKYPDYVLYCTQNPANLLQVKNYLRKLGIPNTRIKSCESEICGSSSANYGNLTYSQLHTIYSALQDELSRKLFIGRLEYSLSHNLASVYRSIICDENINWLQNKHTSNQRYGVNGLWELLKDNYPVQKHRIFFVGVDNDWNEYDWVVDRFLDAMVRLNIRVERCILPFSKTKPSQFKGIPCVKEEEFLSSLDHNTRIIMGVPGWCSQMKDIIEQYKGYKNILFPITDIVYPQYIEPDIFTPKEDEIYVDIGVYNLQNSFDFVRWAKKGYQKIYAFEPNPKCYQDAKAIIENQDDEFKNKIVLVNKGLGASNCVLDFPLEYKGSGFYNDHQTIPVDVITLDSYLDGASVSFVKMDVEGAEMDVLYGMKDTILLHKPKLAVCIYHKHEDVFAITSYLLGLVPEYKFYIRHYTLHETETVLLCKI